MSPNVYIGRKRMKVKQLYVFAATATVTLSLIAVPALTAHAANGDAVASDSAMSKQELKAQKKADSKARHAKKNAELSQLQKNGYNPAGNQTNYPQNLESAQQKAAGQKPNPAPAVAP
jgi:hypothetical protein